MSLTPIDIHRLLPQRHPLLLVDGVEHLDADTIVTTKLVSLTEPCFADRDVRTLDDLAYPSSLLLESFGQSAALLWLETTGQTVATADVLMFAAARDCEFLGDVHPGQLVRHEVTLTSVVADTAFATGRSVVADKTVARFGSVIAVRRARDSAFAVGVATGTIT